MTKRVLIILLTLAGILSLYLIFPQSRGMIVDPPKPVFVKEASAESGLIGNTSIDIESHVWRFGSRIPARITTAGSPSTDCSLNLNAVVSHERSGAKLRIQLSSLQLRKGGQTWAIEDILGGKANALLDVDIETVYRISIEGTIASPNSKEKIVFKPDMVLRMRPLAFDKVIEPTLWERLKMKFK